MTRYNPNRSSQIILSSVICCLLVSGCNLTFQSSQYNFLKALVGPTEAVAVSSWRLTWGELNRSLYPISIDEKSVFTDGGDILVYFDGWNFTRIRGLQGFGVLDRIVLDVDEAVMAEQKTFYSELQPYLEPVHTLVRWQSSVMHSTLWFCNSWNSRTDGIAGFSQSCFAQAQDKEILKVENFINLDEDGMIQAIQANVLLEESEILIELL